ncbi:MAG: FadR family transcriptional regulator [Burkholderiales bacterium]|nr:MAG: FadR family transcriptional regulator [Burkholderiales bacterium]
MRNKKTPTPSTTRSESPSVAPTTRATQVGSGIVTPKLAHLVADRLREQVAAGDLRNGDTLPPEAELLRQFNVSRPIMREALRVLEAENLIQLGRGARAGATVLTPTINTASRYGGLYLATQGTTLGEINQVRMLLEPPLAALLAQRTNKGFLADLESCVTTQREALARQDHAAAIAAVNEFHQQMVKHSENSALNLLAGMLSDISAGAYPRLLLSRPNQRAVWARTEESCAAHAQLLKLISAGKAAQAETFWRKYMQETAEYLIDNSLANLPVGLPRSNT